MRGRTWETWKLSHAYNRIGSGTTPTSSDGRYYTSANGTPWVNTAELRESYISVTQQQVTLEALTTFPALRMYRPGSVVIAMYGATIGRLGMLEAAATCNQACCVFEKSDRFDNRFLFYWLWHRRRDLVALSVGGGQPNLSQQDLREERVLCPPLDTQQRIARFLDEKTDRIDKLIDRKRALLDRLADKRQALITRAVTNGLNPRVPMKPSGINWLGEIPAHWEVRPIYSFQKRITYGFTNPMPATLEGPFMLTANDIGFGQIRYETARRTEQDAYDNYITEKSRPKRGDVLITKDGTLGRVAVFDGRAACINQSVALLRVLPERVDPNFLSFCLLSEPYQEAMLLDAGGTTIKHIYITKLTKMPVGVPNIEEQRDIVAQCNVIFGSVSRAEAKVLRSIQMLDEYRSAVISSAVTGQLTVS